MEFWNGFSDKFDGVLSDTKNGAKKLTDIAKIKFDISRNNERLSKLFEEMGELCYEQHKAGTDFSEKINALLLEADSVSAEIASLKKTEADLKGYKFCSSCNISYGADFDYCSKCGAKLEKCQSDGEENNKE